MINEAIQQGEWLYSASLKVCVLSFGRVGEAAKDKQRKI